MMGVLYGNFNVRGSSSPLHSEIFFHNSAFYMMRLIARSQLCAILQLMS